MDVSTFSQQQFTAFLKVAPDYMPADPLDRLRVNHSQATFAIPSQPEKSTSVITVVILGLIHQRVMFSEDRKGVPCKSPNGEIGIPSHAFPWEHSNFDESNYPPAFAGYRELPCDKCRFKDFDSDLKGGKAPACSEQYTMPLFYSATEPVPTLDRQWQLAIFSVQKTAIQPTRKFLSNFQRRKEPTYTKISKISLSKIGKNDKYWSVPAYEEVESTNADDYARLSYFFRTLRDAITAPPTVDRDGKIVHSQVRYKHRDNFSDLIA